MPLKFSLFFLFIVPQLLFCQIVEEKVPIDTSFIAYKVIYTTTLTKSVFSKEIAVFANDTSKIAVEKNFTNNYQNGIYKAYYPSGRLMVLAIYANSKINGDYTYYDELGKILIKGKYRAGTKHGYWAYRYLNCYGKYFNGKKTGRWKCQSQEGEKFVTKYPDLYLNGATSFFNFKKSKNNIEEKVVLPSEKISGTQDSIETEHNTVVLNQELEKIDTFYLSALTFLARNYYLRNRIKNQFAAKKKDRANYDKYFDYKKDIFLFDAAPLIVSTGLAPFLEEKNALISKVIDSVLVSNPEKYKQAFLLPSSIKMEALHLYSTQPNSGMIVYFSEVVDNLMRVDVVELESLGNAADRNYEEIYKQAAQKKYAILLHFNALKEVGSAEYQQKKIN